VFTTSEYARDPTHPGFSTKEALSDAKIQQERYAGERKRKAEPKVGVRGSQLVLWCGMVVICHSIIHPLRFCLLLLRFSHEQVVLTTCELSPLSLVNFLCLELSLSCTLCCTSLLYALVFLLSYVLAHMRALSLSLWSFFLYALLYFLLCAVLCSLARLFSPSLSLPLFELLNGFSLELSQSSAHPLLHEQAARDVTSLAASVKSRYSQLNTSREQAPSFQKHKKAKTNAKSKAPKRSKKERR
jgi:hypothetical protein